MKGRRPVGRVLLLVLVVLAASACRIRTEVTVDVAEDGSGVVGVAVALDADAMERVPGLAEELRLDDLVATGWTVTGPALEADGLTWIRASKPFGTPEEAAVVLREINGEAGPFREFSVTRERAFARTRFGFLGAVDFSGGLEQFGDEALAEALDGEPLGEDVAEIEARLGEAIDEVFRFRVAVRLPGEVESNAPGGLANGAVWEPRLSADEPVELRATSEVVRTRTLVLTGAAAAAGFAALVVLLSTLFRRRIKARGRHGTSQRASTKS